MILVLGASGRLGRMLRWAWGDRDNITWHLGRADGDILAPSAPFMGILQTARVIVNLAGVTPSPGADLSLNLRLGLAPHQHAPQARILTTSSAAVYGVSTKPHTEDAPLAPPSPYGQSKEVMEDALRNHPNHLILRIGNVAGADQLLGGLGSNTPELHSFADGSTPIRSYIGPRGLADAIDALLDTGCSAQTVNIAAAPVSMGDLLDAAGRSFMKTPAPAALPPNVTLDTTRLHSLCPDLRLATTASDMVAEWTAFRHSGK